MTLHVRLPRGPLTVQPGSSTHCAVVVTNAGTRTEHVTATVLGGAASWTSLCPPLLTLPPGADGVLDAELHPPRVAHVRAGPMPFGVQAESADGPAFAVAEELLRVGSFGDLEAELVPGVVAGRSGSTSLGLRNRGNTTRDVLVAGRDPEERLRVDCHPGGLTIHPGATASVRVRLRGPATPWSGPPRLYPFEVLVRPTDDDPSVVRGTLLVRPWFPATGAPSAAASDLGSFPFG